MSPRKWSAYESLMNEFGCRIIEMELEFENIVLTYDTISLYLNSKIEQHLNPEGMVLQCGVNIYGIGNYEEALKDLEEYSVVFN